MIGAGALKIMISFSEDPGHEVLPTLAAGC
jgi:hypothetical protein